VRHDDVRFGELGYAREARASYLDFMAARERGELPRHVRFQVALPTPFAVCSVITADALAGVEAAYERAMIAEVESLCRHIPHRDLAIQWDICNEMIVWDGQKTGGVPHAEEPPESLLARMRRLCAGIPREVEVGLHLCYGDFAGRHFVEPKDTSQMVSFANALAAAIARPLAYVHMPVPIERADDAFHRPLRELALPSTTELYLAWCTPRTASRARAHASRRRAATRRLSESPRNAAWRGRARRRRCAGSCRSMPRCAGRHDRSPRLRNRYTRTPHNRHAGVTNP
jgi:hypothetical protein